MTGVQTCALPICTLSSRDKSVFVCNSRIPVVLVWSLPCCWTMFTGGHSGALDFTVLILCAFSAIVFVPSIARADPDFVLLLYVSFLFCSFFARADPVPQNLQR